MRIWLINPFDPLPGDPEQEGRYATLARMLRDKGHDVVWWTSSFSHRFKKPVDQVQLQESCRELGIEVFFLEGVAYKKNISVSRLLNHYQLAKSFKKAAGQREDRPDVILVSAPPPFLAKYAVRTARELGARSVIDIQDLWPETFYRLTSGIGRAVLKLVLSPWKQASKSAYCGADVIVGVADQYVNHALDMGAKPEKRATIPLGVDLGQFMQAAKEGECEKFTKPEGEIWFAYTGSLNVSYDCLTLAKAFIEVEKLTDKKGRLFITGRGQLDNELDKIISGSGTSNIVRTGFLDFPEWAYLLSQCDVGFNASFPEAMIYLPNKIFYYFAAGCAVLNTISGQCSQIVSEGECGLDYKAGDVGDCERVMMELIRDVEGLKGQKEKAFNLAVNVYDRSRLYSDYCNTLLSN